MTYYYSMNTPNRQGVKIIKNGNQLTCVDAPNYYNYITDFVAHSKEEAREIVREISYWDIKTMNIGGNCLSWEELALIQGGDSPSKTQSHCSLGVKRIAPCFFTSAASLHRPPGALAASPSRPMIKNTKQLYF